MFSAEPTYLYSNEIVWASNNKLFHAEKSLYDIPVTHFGAQSALEIVVPMLFWGLGFVLKNVDNLDHSHLL